MTTKVLYIKTMISVVELRTLSCKEQHLRVLKIYILQVSEIQAHFEWFKVGSLRSMNKTLPVALTIPVRLIMKSIMRIMTSLVMEIEI